MKATNRQRKILNFFKIPHSPNISVGAAGWEVGALLEDEQNRERWNRYLYLTRDFDSDSPALKDFSEAELTSVEIPDDWNLSAEMQKFHDEVIADEMPDGSPFDHPQPQIEFRGKTFIFTGKFSFGSRKECQNAVVERGGLAPSTKSVSRSIDYLVVGAEGSKAWKRGAYGTKIEAAILSRREHGAPAIVSEEHWASQLKAQ